MTAREQAPTPHVLLVSYLFRPSDRSGARRVTGIRDGLRALGIRTTVLTSTFSGRAEEDAGSVVQARDLRSAGTLKHVVGSSRRRWWSRLVVPDSTAVSWAPAAALQAATIVRHRRPHGVFTSSPPESVHLVGLYLRSRGIPWIADFRDGWTLEPPTLRPYLAGIDRGLERLVLERADTVTAVTSPLADYLQGRARRGRVVHLTNGFDPALTATAPDERGTLDARRFSLVYTGTGGLDGKDPRPFLRALQAMLAEQPALSDRLEVVFAGDFTPEEVAAMEASPLRGVVRTLGHVAHARSLGLQQAADGLLLITSVNCGHVATLKVYEYLAARKPILALADGNAAATLLAGAGPHVLAAPGDEAGILTALRTYVERWLAGDERFRPDVRLEEFTFPRIAHRLAELFAEVGAFSFAPG